MGTETIVNHYLSIIYIDKLKTHDVNTSELFERTRSSRSGSSSSPNPSSRTIPTTSSAASVRTPVMESVPV